MDESYHENTWANGVTVFKVSSDSRCAIGTHNITATLSTGNTVTAQVEGVFAVRQVAGKSYLYYGVCRFLISLINNNNFITMPWQLESCEGVGSATDAELDEMCNTRIPTHHITKLKREACLVTNCYNAAAMAACATS